MHYLDQVLRQRHEIATREGDELKDRFQDSVKGTHMKSGFRSLLLEKKLGSLVEEAEKRDACVNEVGIGGPPIGGGTVKPRLKNL